MRLDLRETIQKFRVVAHECRQTARVHPPGHGIDGLRSREADGSLLKIEQPGNMFFSGHPRRLLEFAKPQLAHLAPRPQSALHDEFGGGARGARARPFQSLAGESAAEGIVKLTRPRTRGVKGRIIGLGRRQIVERGFGELPKDTGVRPVVLGRRFTRQSQHA